MGARAKEVLQQLTVAAEARVEASWPLTQYWGVIFHRQFREMDDYDEHLRMIITYPEEEIFEWAREQYANFLWAEEAQYRYGFRM